MKVSVVGYRTRKEDEPPIHPRKPWENIDVWFSPHRGDWLMDYKELAQRELDLLASRRVHVNEHYCQLELTVLLWRPCRPIADVQRRASASVRSQPERTARGRSSAAG
jgi:hypothetical protein